MNAQISLQNLTTPVSLLETPHRCRSASVVTPKIDQRLFALKNCGHDWLSSIRAIRRYDSSDADPFGQFARPVGYNDVRPGALQRSHDLKRGRAFVHDAFFGCRLDHRVFTADVVNRGDQGGSRKRDRK